MLTQTLEHDVKPVAHPHVPLLHVMLSPDVPQAVPLATGPSSVQVCVPVEHEVVPEWHEFGGLPGVQLALAVHGEQVPTLQTSLPSQVVPLATFVSVSMQTEVPVAQDVEPTWQGLVGVQLALAVHGEQVPALQTSLLAHVVPLATFVSVSTQTEVPVAQEVEPTWQGLVGVQLALAVHCVHVPLLQTSLLPHVVPFAAFAPVSTHVEAPVLHDVSPVWHGLAGVQAVPAVQATHDPDALHTSLVAHDVPVVTLTPVSTHTDVPVLHDVSPA